MPRLEEEVAPFEAEKSEIQETSEPSPWAHLQKTYSNVEEGAHSLPGDQLHGNLGGLPVHQEITTVVEQPMPSMQVRAANHVLQMQLPPASHCLCQPENYLAGAKLHSI